MMYSCSRTRQVGVVLGLYTSYWYLNWLVSTTARTWSLASPVRVLFSRVLGIGLQVGWLAFLLALVVNAATYYAQPHLFNYGPDFRLLSLFGYNDRPLTNWFAGGGRALGLLVLAGGYSTAREGLIRLVERPSPRRAYRVSITNQLTAFAVVYLVIGCYLVTFGWGSGAFHLGYFLLIPPALLVYFSTTYWLFPVTPAGGFRTARFAGRLALTTLLSTAPFALQLANMENGEAWAAILLGGWASQLLLVTPLAWLLYQQQQDKILQLRGVETRLVQSTTDLYRLRAQLNPHFLFNTLNTLYGTALMEKAGRTAEGIQMLGDLMRVMLEESTQESIALSREVDYLRNYIALQTLRTQPSPHIRIEAHLPDAPDAHELAPMLLQPFVENAFKHGISLREASWIYLRLHCEANVLRLEVRNSLHVRPRGDQNSASSTGLGLQNATQRLNLLYANRYELRYGREGSEYVVRLALRLTA